MMEPDRHMNHRMPGPHRMDAVKMHLACGCCPCFKVTDGMVEG